MKITLLLGCIGFAGACFPSFGSEDSVCDKRPVIACEAIENDALWRDYLIDPVKNLEEATPAHKKGRAPGVRIQLGNDGNDNVLSPDANRPFRGSDGAGRSSVFVTATALLLASRALKSR